MELGCDAKELNFIYPAFQFIPVPKFLYGQKLTNVVKINLCINIEKAGYMYVVT
jgi:hypothetical protein